MTVVPLFLNKSKMDEKSRVGVGVTVGVADGILVGILMREDGPERWLEISSFVLMA